MCEQIGHIYEIENSVGESIVITISNKSGCSSYIGNIHHFTYTRFFLINKHHYYCEQIKDIY